MLGRLPEQGREWCKGGYEVLDKLKRDRLLVLGDRGAAALAVGACGLESGLARRQAPGPT